MTLCDTSDQPTFKYDSVWSLDAIGISDSPFATEDDSALQHFHSTIRFNNGRYEITWPWKSDQPDLQDNYQFARDRFKSLSRRLHANSSLFAAYSSILQQQLENGIIERITNTAITGTLQHYLAHHPIVSPSTTTSKIRIVYDASAKIRPWTKTLNNYSGNRRSWPQNQS